MLTHHATVISITRTRPYRHTVSNPRRERRTRKSPTLNATRTQPHTAIAETRHTFVTTMLDAGVDLRDVQIAARHADPRTTMRYDRAHQNLDRHPNYILAAFMASGT
jgi:integrase/recombinase XerD